MVILSSSPNWPPRYNFLLLQTALPCLLAIGFLVLTAQAAPTPGNVALAQKYAPEFRFQ